LKYWMPGGKSPSQLSSAVAGSRERTLVPWLNVPLAAVKQMIRASTYAKAFRRLPCSVNAVGKLDVTSAKSTVVSAPLRRKPLASGGHGSGGGSSGGGGGGGNRGGGEYVSYQRCMVWPGCGVDSQLAQT